MGTTKRNLRCFALTLIAGLLVALPAAARDFSVDGPRTVTFNLENPDGVQMTVSGPGGYLYQQTFEGGAALVWNDMDADEDGIYTFELSALGAHRIRGENAPPRHAGELISGSLRMEGGALVEPHELENVTKDQLILDDLIVDGSLCVGMDCVNGESFGFDTIRLKENNLRIRFVDTSSTSSFPSRDWQITVNDSANGGLNKFSIDDIDGGRTPFTIEAGAPSHSLYVDDGGRLGLGTSTPVVDVHIKSGNTPTLRLEQDGSSGFTPQTWDVAGNEANFFVRDATNGSTLPFRIFPGAPSNALNLQADGNVSVGATGPTLLGSNDIAFSITVTSGPVRLGLQNAVEDWAIVNDSGSQDLIFASSTDPTGVLVLDETGLTPGVNPGTDLCVGAGNVLCECGSCP
jgi:hypothetical protein